MNNTEAKLQAAFDKGFVPADLKEAMDNREHVGRVWLVTDNDHARLGVGYKLQNEDGTFQNQIHWYDKLQVEKLLGELG